MTMIKREPVHAGQFIIDEANGKRARSSIVINAGAGYLQAGTLIAELTAANAAVVTPGGGNTGNGTLGSVTVGNAAITGDYLVTITKASTDSGVFNVVDPNGDEIGTGEVGVAFDKEGLAFTLDDGATDFAEGDTWTLAVNAGLGEWVKYDDTGTDDGRRACGGILYGPADARFADALATVVDADASVNTELLTGLDDNGAADLKALGIKLR